MARKTKAQLLAENQRNTDLAAAHYRGVCEGRASVQDQFKAEKLAQLQAVTQLLEQTGRVLSRAGYLLGKMNNDNSR